jgi:hypothetical protein
LLNFGATDVKMAAMGADHLRRSITVTNLIALCVALLILFSLLIPQMGSARVTTLRTQCANNLKELAIATLQFESKKQQYPWYIQKLHDKHATAIVRMLPHLGRNDLYEEWLDSSQRELSSNTQISLLTCPSSETVAGKSAPLSYAFNSGEAVVESQANGIFFNGLAGKPITTNANYVANHDGLSFTILCAENLQANTWLVSDANNARLWTTIVWHASQPVNPAWKLNSKCASTVPIAELTFARPSSNHPGCVVTAFCDGNVKKIDESIDYDVYCQLMTPNGAKSNDPVNRKATDQGYE